VSVTVNIRIKEVYELLCEECKRKLERLLRERVTEELVRSMLR